MHKNNKNNKKNKKGGGLTFCDTQLRMLGQCFVLKMDLSQFYVNDQVSVKFDSEAQAFMLSSKSAPDIDSGQLKLQQRAVVDANQQLSLMRQEKDIYEDIQALANTIRAK